VKFSLASNEHHQPGRQHSQGSEVIAGQASDEGGVVAEEFVQETEGAVSNEV
jgi:hypothetical protein